MSTPDQALTLQLRDPRSGPAQAQAQVRLHRGGSIGRGGACDWVLEADGVSRLHASVRCLDGLFFIEDHSTNGVLHNGCALRPGIPAALKHGDWLKIDVFEIDVAISGESPAANATDMPYAADEGAHAFVPDVAISVLSGSEHGYVDEHDIHALLAGPQTAVAVDPLALLDRADDGASQWSMGGWNHTPAASAAYSVPNAVAAAPSAAVLPENWDRTRTQYSPEPAANSQPLAAAPARAREHDAPEANTSQRRDAIAQAESTTHPASLRASIATAGSESTAPDADLRGATDVLAQFDPPVVLRPMPLPQITATPQPATDRAPERAVHHAAHPVARPAVEPSEPARDRPSTAAEASLLATTMNGVMDLLRARAEFKNGLRLPSTLVQRRENNPLKFAPSADEAIERLLGPGDGAYLSGEAAIEDAMRDIRHHQLALLAAMRIALDSTFARFDPTRFEDAVAKSALSHWNGKPWRRYRDHYRALSEDPDERYRSLFGDEFARAYEEQMNHLKSSEASGHRSSGS